MSPLPKGILPLEIEAEWPKLLVLIQGKENWLALVFLEAQAHEGFKQRLSKALIAGEQDLVLLSLPADPSQSLDLGQQGIPFDPSQTRPCRVCILPEGGASLTARLGELEAWIPNPKAADASSSSAPDSLPWQEFLAGGLILVMPGSAKETVELRAPKLLEIADLLLGGEVSPGPVSETSEEQRAEHAARALKAATGARARGAMVRTRGQALRALAALEPLDQLGSLLPQYQRALDVLAHAEHDLGDAAACKDHADAWIARLPASNPRDRVRAHVLAARAERQLTGERSPGDLGSGHAAEAARVARQLWAEDPSQDAHGRLLSLALDILGLVHRDAGRADDALTVQREAVDVDRALVERNEDDPVLLRNLSVGLEHLGDTLREAGESIQAGHCYRECFKQRRRMAKPEDAGAETLHEVFEVLWRIAALSDEESDKEQTSATLKTARTYLLRARNQAPDSPRITRDLAAVEDWLRDIEA